MADQPKTKIVGGIEYSLGDDGIYHPITPEQDSNPAILGALNSFYDKLKGTGDKTQDPYAKAANTLSKTARSPGGQEFMKNNPFKK